MKEEDAPEGSADVPLELLPCVRERTKPLHGKCASRSGHGIGDEIIIKAFLRWSLFCVEFYTGINASVASLHAHTFPGPNKQVTDTSPSLSLWPQIAHCPI